MCGLGLAKLIGLKSERFVFALAHRKLALSAKLTLAAPLIRSIGAECHG